MSKPLDAWTSVGIGLAIVAIIVGLIMIVGHSRSRQIFLSDFKSFVHRERTFQYRRFNYYAVYTGRTIATKFYENGVEIFTLWIDIEACYYSKDYVTKQFDESLERYDTRIARCKEIKEGRAI